MSELLRDGFEYGALTTLNWSAVNSAVLDTGIFHSGLASLKIFPSGTTARNVRRDVTGNPSTGTYFSRFYIYVVATAAAADPTIHEYKSSSNASNQFVRLMRDKKIRLENVAGGATVATTTTVLTVNTWYRIEVRTLLKTDATGETELNLYLGESNTALENLLITGEITTATNLGLIYFGQATNANNGTQFYLDDVGINSDAGSTQNTWLGPGKMWGITAVNDNAIAWTPSTGTDSFANVDDAPGASPNDATDYNSVVTNSVEDRFYFTGYPAEVPSTAVMKCISLWGRYALDAANSNTFCLKIWDEANVGTQGPTITYALTAWLTTTISLHQSYDLTGKTRANMLDFNIGYRSLTGTAAKRFTAIYGHVEWIESAGQTLAVDSGSYSSSGQVALLRLASPLYLRHRK